MLAWVYYSAQVFLLGAEFTWAYALTFGSRRAQPLPAAAPAVPSQTAETRPDMNMVEAKQAATEEGLGRQEKKKSE
jgi:membrane protein